MGEEDVVVNETEVTETETEVNDTEIDDTEVNEIVEETETETDEEFDPDKMFDDDNEQYQVAGYDLSKYKDVLNFENEAVMLEFTEYAQKYADAGFTQEQIELLLDERLVNDVEDKPKKLSNKEIQDRLNKGLSREEKRNYKAINSFVVGALHGTELEDKSRDIMKNPALVKLMNIVYKKSLGTTTNIKATQKPKETTIKTMSLDEAYDKLLESTKDSSVDKTKLISELKSRVADKKGLDKLLSIIL